MANFEVGKIRNVAVIAHGGAGKTSLIEAMLFDCGMTDRLGNVQDGTTVTDYEPEEIDRKITITSSLAFCNWDKHRINLMDTPGFINFIEDTRGCLRVADGAPAPEPVAEPPRSRALRPGGHSGHQAPACPPGRSRGRRGQGGGGIAGLCRASA